MKLLTFPKNFAWGTSSSAVMVEENTPGCPRGETIWDRQFRAASGESLTTPSEGAGHIARFRDDIRLLKRLGIPHYNFSLSWSRIFPGGTGQVSSGGLDFYQKLVDELCRHSITPWITLYGNDMPQPLQDRGGWLCRDTAGYFTDFAENMAAVFSDRVNRWITLSDPYTELNFGYRLGSHAPGYADPERTFIAAHNMLLGHAGGQAALKSCGKPLKAGISVSINPPKRIGFLPSRIKRIAEEFMMYLFLDPVFLGRYPVILETRIFSQNRENIQPNDLEKINHSPDFIILRHSGFTTIRRGILSNYLRYREINPRSRLKSTGSVATIAPESLKTVLNSISERYGNPPVIVFPTCTLDIQSENGINDHVRTYFYRQYLAETHSAITRGINIIGFLAGPFIDGFEFDNKGQFRSGIVHVDFSTRERQIKSSAQWYSGVCTHNGFKP